MMTSLDFPVGDRKMNVKRRVSRTQATRWQPAETSEGWDCEFAPATSCPWMFVKTIDEARELAAKSGFDGILL